MLSVELICNQSEDDDNQNRNERLFLIWQLKGLFRHTIITSETIRFYKKILFTNQVKKYLFSRQSTY